MISTLKCPVCGEASSVSDFNSVEKVTCQCGWDLDPSSAEPSGSSSDGAAPLPASARRPGNDLPERVGRYRIEREIGAGAFGAVYLAHDDDRGRPVALKVAHPDVVLDPDLFERFLKEARAAQRIHHEGIVEVYEADSDGSRFYIASEYVDGRTLKAVLAEGPLDVERAVRIASSLAQSLGHAHAAGVVHRDVKPSNVMITVAGDVKLIDFGLARLDSSTQTREHAFLGTTVYMSPEQASGQARNVRNPSDQYSLAVVLYEMLCGRPPFRGEIESTLSKIVHQAVPALRELNPAISEDLESIITKALSKDPAGRYPNCRGLADALLAWLDGRGQDVPGLAGPGPLDDPPSSIHQTLRGPVPVADDSVASWSSDPAPVHHLRSRDPLHALLGLADERADREERAKRALAGEIAVAEREVEELRNQAKAKLEADRATLVEAEGRRQKHLELKKETDLAAAQATYQRRCDWIRGQVETAVVEAEEKCRWHIVEADGVRGAKAHKAHVVFDKETRRVEEEIQAADDLWFRLVAVGERYRRPLLRDPWDMPPAPGGPRRMRQARERLSLVRRWLTELESRPASRLLGRVAVALPCALVFLVVIVSASRPFGWPIAAVAAVGVTAFFNRVALSRLIEPWASRIDTLIGEVHRDLASTIHYLQTRRARLKSSLPKWLLKLEGRLQQANRRAEEKKARNIALFENWRAVKMKEAGSMFQKKCQAIRSGERYGAQARSRVAERDRKYRKQRLHMDRQHRDRLRAARARHDTDWEALALWWRGGLTEVAASVAAIREGVERLNPVWESSIWASWSLPSAAPSVVRFGEVTIGLDRVPRGMPKDEGLLDGLPREFVWPALLHFPDRANLLLEIPWAARAEAVRVLQAAVTRLLTSLPPGQARLTIIDPEGLGSDFGAFLQLTDFDAVIAPVKSEPEQIEQTLADHLGHMKKIIQSYLRNDHRTICEYNERAGEVAEPFRILVVADFPSRFSEESRARLARIASQGPKCGVVTLVASVVDRPAWGGVQPPELAENAVRLVWKDERFVWDDPAFGLFPLSPDPPPPPALATRVLRLVGSATEEARRVEVPFEFVTPPVERWWAGDSRAGVEVALGKTGPTKAQTLVLGKGTSQHVLIAGRTGSGKSSLLHALITNVALNYGPDEIELYLIDFKKGVEFKTYATHELPHARVVAVESEREFGVSVLRRLDEELIERGERFREAGVQDLKGYRRIEGLPPLPRILLIVDEFHEFFVEEDGLASDAAQLLDRLVRQGRAFGVHVLLGTQTLSGAYSLARSTLSQIAVRIALQCSESDAHLILSEDNGAARLLSRPGEAIYNDDNGRAEGNHFFQVVWLSDDRREDYLKHIRALADARNWRPSAPQVVFEGNAVASLPRNLTLAARLAAPGWPSSSRSALAWLGDPVAIKAPTAATFRRQVGNHLLILGQNADAAAGVMCSSMLSLAAQFPPSGPSSARFLVLDGTPEDAATTAPFAPTCAVLPHHVAVSGRRQVAEVLDQIAVEVEARAAADAPPASSIFLFIYNLAWFRELRRDDEYDFAAVRDPARPSAGFMKVLREGPPVGVHVIAWCDSLINLNRALDRPTQREFGARVVFQISASDSTHLLDSPLAGKLGPHRALFIDEENSQVEKFRPYGAPPLDWLEKVHDQFLRRGAP